MSFCSRARLFGWAALTVAALVGGARAAPTQSQIDAVRQSCRGDYMAHCSGVQPGGSAALSCLMQHQSAVSAPCQRALSAIAPAKPTAAAPTSQAAPATTQRVSAQDEATWPHTLSEPDGSVTVYQPQAIAWPDHATLRARAAVAITPSGRDKPILGTIEVEGTTHTDDATGTVVFTDPKLVSSRFPALDTGQATQLDTRIRAVLASLGPKRVPLQSVLLSLGEPAQSTPDLRNEPPHISYSAKPASLVVFDGDPVLVPVANSAPLSAAVNTNWDVFFDTTNKAWYLLANGAWLTASDVKGPWRAAGALPAAFQSLPADANFAAVRKSIPGRTLAADAVPTIFVSTEPAEIIVTEGVPQFASVRGTSLRRVTNTSAT
ncbi:MAG: hypothetical protein JOY70_02495, partial [Acidisphaera sp.]|nr:hypothetical protein [Acidisphaera sp.]